MCHSFELDSLSLAEMSSCLFCCFHVNYYILVTTQGLKIATPNCHLPLFKRIEQHCASAFQALLPGQVRQSWLLASATEAPAYSVGRSPPAALNSCFLAEAGSIWQQRKNSKMLPLWHAIQATVCGQLTIHAFTSRCMSKRCTTGKSFEMGSP